MREIWLVFDVIFENADLLVINKATNVSTLADRSGQACLWDRLRETYPTPRLVHRLDKGTSGVMAVALNAATQSALTRAFTERRVDKYYVARVVGQLPLDGTGIIDLPLRKGRKSRYRVAGQRDAIARSGNRWSLPQANEGHASLTRCRLVKDGRGDRVILKPLTGRTHQLRVHLSWIGYPIVGDTLYGKPSAPEQAGERLMLHAHKLTLPGFGSFCAPAGSAFEI